MKACHDVTDGEVIAIDGKTVRSSYDKSKRRGAIHMVSAFASANGVVIGQVKTDGKSNEITPIPDLLKLLDIKGCLVTIDAMGCQRDITNGILQSLECSDGSIMVAKCNLIILIPNSTKQLFSLQPQQGKRTNPLISLG